MIYISKNVNKDFANRIGITPKHFIDIFNKMLYNKVRKVRNIKRKVFIQKGKDIVIKNSAMIALEKIQEAFEGEAERLNLKTEEDVVKMIKEFRRKESGN